jgi:site-specific DNA-cytosine methylase
VFVVGHFADWKRPAAVLFDGTQHRANAVEAEEILQREHSIVDGTRPVLGWSGDETPKYGLEIAPTIRSHQGGEGTGFIRGRTVRRFTINELETMQGLDRDYTFLPKASDAVRRKAIGNAFCANVLRWIAGRIAAVDG